MTNKEGVVDAGSGNEVQTKILAESDSNASFLRAARAGNLDKIREYLKGSIDINTSNANGLNALHLASKEGHVPVVLELVKSGANVNAATKKGNTALHIASLAGQEEVVKILIRSGANANVQSQNGFTPLYMAAQENHDGVVKFLLANNANQSLATEDGFTPLAVALQQGHDKVVAVLLENDAKGRVRLPALHIAAKKDDCKAAALLLQNDHDPDVTSKSGFTPLHIAAHYGNENIASLLLEKNADVNYSAKHQITPLHVAAKWGKSNMVTLLVDKGAKIDASTRDGLTPLHCAARSGHDQVVDLLLEKGAPITAKTKNGLAPLHMASQGDHVDGARILLFHKAPVDDVTVDYLTALHVAAHCGHVRVAKLLLDRKADPNSRALNGFTPLHIACKKNRIKVVELLLKHGASIEATTESGLTPLHVASFMGCMNIVIYLIQHGANPDVPTVRGETPLHLAARANQSDIIRILLRNGAHVDASAREQQTPLHIAARLGNVDIVGLLLQHGAAVDATTKDMYTALHIAAKEGQEEVAAVLLDHGASLTATTKKGFTPLHLAAKYGNIKVARLLLQKDAPVDAQGKNGVTPLHVAAHYDNVNVALLLLDKGAFPHATAKNGYTPLHIAAKKNQMDIATTLLEYGAKPSAESKAGFTPLHLAAQEGHTDMTTLLIEHHADVNSPAKNGLTPLHLCSQEDKLNVAAILVKNGAKVDPPTKAGYTPLHVACHFGQINMIRFLLQHKADVNATTSHGYTPLHQAAQQGHTLIINLLLEHKASPNTTTNQGQTALSIAQRLGYISVVETLKVVTETIVTTTTTTVTEEKYKVVAPETMQETFMSDSEDEGADDTMMGDQSLHYMTTDELKALADDNTLGIDVTRDERGTDSMLTAPLTAEEDHLTPQHVTHQETTFSSSIAPDNVDLARAPVHAGFLVSFMVDARGGAMRGCRHSGVRVIIPPRKAPMPMRITCRYLRKEKLAYPPPLMEGEACASRILEVGPSGAKFLGPVIIEVPHFASLRGREREITILRSDNGESWREHTLEASDDAVHDVFNESFEGEELSAIEDLSTSRITRILTTDFPQYFAIVTRVRQEVHAIGPEGGMVSSTVVPQVQAIFPEGALTKKIKVGLQAQPITPELVTKLLGNRVAVSPIVTVEPRRRKFHKPITLTIPVPQAATKGMINQYSGDAPTLRLLCSITGGTTKAQWEDVTGSTPLTFVNDCVSFTTTVSARFWLMDCRQVNEATKFATELYREAIHVPFMAKFVVFAKRHDPLEAQLRVFCMTDDKEDKTLESQEHFTEVAKSRDVEVLEGKPQYLEFAGNLIPVTKSGEQLSLTFQAFRENRLPFTIRVKDPHQEPMGRVAFMREPRVGRGEAPQSPICNLNIVLPETDLTPVSELVTLERKYGFVKETSLAKPELIHRADLRLSDIAKELKDDWVLLALQLDLPESDINSIRSENPGDTSQQALVMLRHWLQRTGNKATGNSLEKGLRKINREDIVNQCMFNVELVTDDVEKAVAKVHLDQSGFETFKEELGSSRDASLRRETSLNGTFDEQDIMKEAESAAETSSESSDKEAHFRAEGRHSEGRVSSEAVTRTSARVVEEAPETLVQNVPTALAESFTQQTTNGQLSDSSMHEDDKSEPTVATLSSEATAELEVSSLEDKSQGETKVEKRDHYKSSGFMKQVHGSAASSSLKCGIKDSPRNVKLHKQLKHFSCPYTENRKVTFNVQYRTMTPPATMRKRKVIIRRNSWPPLSPLKLNKRKKYQQRLKIEDLREPFWTNTYEWLTMKIAPEGVREAPLVKLVEFSQLENSIDFIKPKHFHSTVAETMLPTKELKKTYKFQIPDLKSPEVIHFYFMNFANKRPKNENDKKLIRDLKKKCLLQELRSYTIRSLKPTNFNDAEHSLDNAENISANCSRTEICSTFSIVNDAAMSDITADVYLNDYNEDICEVPEIDSHQEIYRSSQTIATRTSLRPLQSSNIVSQAEVVAYNPIINLDNRINLKQKVTIRDTFQNKENILKKSKDFPSSKFSDNFERAKDREKKDSAAPLIQKNLNQFSETCSEKKAKYLDRYPINIYHNHVPNILPNSLPNKSNYQDIINYCPQDMPDHKTQGSKEVTNPKPSSQASKSTDGKSVESRSSVPSGSGVRSDPGGLSSSAQISGSSHGDDQSNKPYLRQLFEKDIQSNFSKSSKIVKEEKKESDKAKDKNMPEKQLDSSVESESGIASNVPAEIGERFLRNLSSEISASQGTSKAIPASVLGQSFLKTLQERVQVEETSGETSFPASVIGHAFVNALLGQQSKVSEVTPESKPIPAAVLGQTFLKGLVTDQSCYSDDKGKTTDFGQTHARCSTDQISGDLQTKSIPSSVIGQSFLKTLVEESAQESAKELPIPSSVVGQAFLKTLVENTSPESMQEVLNPALVENQSSQQPLKEKPVPASVIGQAFLKTLVSDQTSPEGDVIKTESTSSTKMPLHDSKESSVGNEPIPSSVVGQAFLKTLIENQSDVSVHSCSKPTFRAAEHASPKSLSENPRNPESSDNPENPESSDNASKVVPSTVIGLSFLKSLLDEQQQSAESESKSIPASVASQAFPKTVVQNQSVEKADAPSTTTIPAPVLGQFFLKSLVQDQSAGDTSGGSQAIPAPVVGQAFLKTLLECKSDSASETEKVIPSSVVGQSFLKSLIETQTELEKQSVTGIPHSVAKQKESDPVSKTSAVEPIPATVIGQAFLKTLVDTERKSETQEDKVPPIPAPVISQTFLKSLISEQVKTESCGESPATSSAVGKTQLNEEKLKGNEQPIPSSVVGQAFLKTLVVKTDSGEGQRSEAIPSTVVGQAFLKTLLSESQEVVATSTASSRGTAIFHEAKHTPQEAPIPSSVIGLAFLKTLTEQSELESAKNIPQMKNVTEGSSDKPIPAGVVGQAFLKTLASVPSEPVLESVSSTSQSKSSVSEKQLEGCEGNGCYKGHSKNNLHHEQKIWSESFAEALKEFDPLNECRSDPPELSEEQCPIIPPPPEFGPSIDESDFSATDVDPGLIGELLSCTQLVHSILESMEEERESVRIPQSDIASGSGSSTKNVESSKMYKKS